MYGKLLNKEYSVCSTGVMGRVNTTNKVAYVQRNTEARSHKPQLPWKISKQYLFWVCVCSL
jgi:hypothetical protein